MALHGGTGVADISKRERERERERESGERNESRYNLNKISTLWAISELLAAREVARERRRRNADAAVDYRKRQK